MKGFIEVQYSSDNKSMLIAISAIISVRVGRKSKEDTEANITLTEREKEGNVDLYVNHSYSEVVQKIENAS